MTAPISFAHSPFLYQHVPNSPFLLPRRTQVTQSPAPFVPDIDTLRENRYTGGRNAMLRSPYLLTDQHLHSPTPVVPSISAPSTPLHQHGISSVDNVSSVLQKEQVVPNFSPLTKKDEVGPSKRKERRLDSSPSQASTVPEIELFSGDEIFA
ncbi:unnamed protein product [Porites lobata]|uniref:Uncharacterized protein n=1 Tax=Porites lobata TaxID=104759 RepID=A0ABN8SD02_9CNID|nr:unnamed protein product [Porites lobata]